MLDPNKIRCGRIVRRVADLLDQTDPAYDLPVTLEEMTAAVELLLVNGPMPEVVITDRMDSTDRVELGGKFVAALRAFAAGRPLGTTVFMPEWSGKALKELPGGIYRRFLNRDVCVTRIEVGTPPDVTAALVAGLTACR
jgi:hypothetical protein